MPDSVHAHGDAMRDLAEFHGQPLANAIDRRYERLLSEQIQLWDAQLSKQGTWRPDLFSLREQLNEYRWTSFAGARITWDEPTRLWLRFRPETYNYFDLLVGEQPIDQETAG